MNFEYIIGGDGGGRGGGGDRTRPLLEIYLVIKNEDNYKPENIV